MSPFRETGGRSRRFGEPKATEGVGFFDGILLVGGVGVGVIGRDAEDCSSSRWSRISVPLPVLHVSQGGESAPGKACATRTDLAVWARNEGDPVARAILAALEDDPAASAVF